MTGVAVRKRGAPRKGKAGLAGQQIGDTWRSREERRVKAGRGKPHRTGSTGGPWTWYGHNVGLPRAQATEVF